MSDSGPFPTLQEALARHAAIRGAINQPGLDPQEKAAAVGLLVQIDKFVSYYPAVGQVDTSFSRYLKPKKHINKK
jgi:hypothetical protein